MIHIAFLAQRSCHVTADQSLQRTSARLHRQNAAIGSMHARISSNLPARRGLNRDKTPS